MGLLIARVLASAGRGRAITLTPEAARALHRHDWPLNVRELEQCLARAVMLSADDGIIGVDRFPEALQDTRRRGRVGRLRRALRRRRATRAELINRLTRTAGNVSVVAREMGKARAQIHRWLRRFGLDPESFRAR